MQAAVIATRFGTMTHDYLLTGGDEIAKLVGGVILNRAFEQHVDFVEAQRKNLAAEINNAIVRAFGS